MDWFHVVVIGIALLVCYKWGDWRQWNKYYSTIQFIIIGDFIYNILFPNKMLWLYVSTMLNHTIIDILIAVFVFPSTVMVFIPHYPKGILKQSIYIIFWVFIYGVVEYVSHVLGFFTYDNGWNTLWSIVFLVGMFPLLYLHYRKPLLAWLFAIIELVICLIIFKVDILSLI